MKCWRCGRGTFGRTCGEYPNCPPMEYHESDAEVVERELAERPDGSDPGDDPGDRLAWIIAERDEALEKLRVMRLNVIALMGEHAEQGCVCCDMAAETCATLTKERNHLATELTALRDADVARAVRKRSQEGK
jgi:hypothetical protein